MKTIREHYEELVARDLTEDELLDALTSLARDTRDLLAKRVEEVMQVVQDPKVRAGMAFAIQAMQVTRIMSPVKLKQRDHDIEQINREITEAVKAAESKQR